MSRDYLVVFVTVPSAKAKEIARYILLEKKAACVNIINGVTSLFWWQKDIDLGRESLLIIKTQNKMFGQLKRAIILKHPYKIPEIIALPIIKANNEYLKWIDAVIR